MDDSIFIPRFDFGQFRYLVARYVKLLIRARWRAEPRFLKADQLHRWSLANIERDATPAWLLAGMATDTLAIINSDYLALCGSGGIQETDENTPIGRLIENVYGLVSPEGGGPWHNGALLTVTSLLKEGQPVAWNSVINWGLLPPIREDLDRLPLPTRPGADKKSLTGPTETESEPDNFFRRCGASWNVRFRGGRVNAYNNTAGAMYVHHLLPRPDQEVSAEVLGAKWVSFQKKSSQGTINAPAAAGLNIDRTSSAGPRTTWEGLKMAFREVQELDEEIEEARNNNDFGRAEAKEKEKDFILSETKKATRPCGKLADVADESRRIANRVTKAIQRFIAGLHQKDTNLANHLDCFISTGAHCTYAPDSPVKWET